jgi:hypothetical protein
MMSPITSGVTGGELEANLLHNGFEVLLLSSCTALLSPLMAANRLMTGSSEANDDHSRLDFHTNAVFRRDREAVATV